MEFLVGTRSRMMPKRTRVLAFFLSLGAVQILGACSGSGSTHGSVYAGYGYPYHRYGYNDCCYDQPDRPDRPDRPDIPDRPDRPVNLPARPDRPAHKPGGGMGRPSRRR
jgi:hypothetical protein